MNNPPDELLKLPPEQLLSWVQARLEGTESCSSEFNWHGLAFTAASKASAPGASPVWGEVAVRVYSWLAQHAGDARGQGFTDSEMHVRATQILRHGSLAGHIVRDITVPMAWFRQAVDRPLSETRALTQDWRQLPLTEIRKLRVIKNRLRVLSRLADVLPTPDLDEVRDWLELRPHLP